MDQEDTRLANGTPTNWQQELEKIRNQKFQFSCLGMGCLAWIIILLAAWALWYYYA